MNQPLQFRAILIGGLIGGLLSAIPGLGILTDCCCCGGFVSLGAVIASFYYVQRTLTYPGDGDGLVIGLGSGALAGTIAGLSSALIQLLTSRVQMEQSAEEMAKLFQFLPPQFQELMRQSLEQSAQQPRGLAVVMSMILIVVLATLAGGLFGFLSLRFFRDRRIRQFAAAAPAPPPYFVQPGQVAPPPAPIAAPPPSAPPAAPPLGVPWGPADPSGPGPGDKTD